MEVQRISEDDIRKISDFECIEESMEDFLKGEAMQCDVMLMEKETHTY